MSMYLNLNICVCVIKFSQLIVISFFFNKYLLIIIFLLLADLI